MLDFVSDDDGCQECVKKREKEEGVNSWNKFCRVASLFFFFFFWGEGLNFMHLMIM